jgi:hypothetical protein
LKHFGLLIFGHRRGYTKSRKKGEANFLVEVVMWYKGKGHMLVNEIGVLNLQMKNEMKNGFKNGEIMKNGS